MLIFYLIIFSISLIFSIVLWYGKVRERRGGEPVIYIGSSNMDIRLREMYAHSIQFMKSIDKQYISDVFHKIAEKIEQYGIILIEKVVSRFGTVRDIVVGKDLPKNKGAVSFYFKHIEVFKKNKKNNPVSTGTSASDRGLAKSDKI